MKHVVKWKNRRSGETGYVEKINRKEDHFVSTQEIKDAMHYANAGLASSAITTLYNLADSAENDYESVPVAG